MANEKKTDIIISGLLDKAGIKATPNGSDIKEVADALKTASKRETGKKGFPEFVAKVGDFLIVIEDKSDFSKQIKYLDEEKKTVLLMDNTSITDYAVNGAVHYATHIVNHTSFKKVFAFGCSGTSSNRITIIPIFVSPAGYKLLKQQKDFSNFSNEKIQSFYEQDVLNQKSQDQIELENILSNASALHTYLHRYGFLSNLEKPVVVSALLLALQNEDFDTEDLLGLQKSPDDDPYAIVTDGEIIIEFVKKYMDLVQVEPGQKKSQVLNQFLFIKERPILSQVVEELGKTPLRFFAEYLYSNVLTAFNYNSAEDVLGRFYGEFMSYSGGDGQSLGIILTPKHITQLMCELVKVDSHDRVFDPTCGTAGFLVAAMPMMLDKANTQQEREHIKKHQLHGIEMNEGMFSIATTNMILRGDGKSNLLCDDFFAYSSAELRKKHYTVGLMNPPYAVASHSELQFISHLLDSLDDGARCAVIIPQSTMVGKNNTDKSEKNYILLNHTLEGVITLNPQTFFGVGTNPAIAVFTAHRPHPDNYYAKFIDFKEDGYVVAPHVGLIHTPKADELKKKLIECWHNNRPANNKFMVRAKVSSSDEWLHAFYYFNENIPTENDFMKTMADYITFEFNMICHGREYLFKDNVNSHHKRHALKLSDRKWKPFNIEQICIIKSGCDIYERERRPGNIPYVTATAANNGVGYFVSNNNSTLESECISINRNGSVGYAFYHDYEALFGNDTRKLIPNFKNKYSSLFLVQALVSQKDKYGYGYKMGTGRLQRQSIMLPYIDENQPDFEFMKNYMEEIEYKLLTNYKSKKFPE